MYSDLVWAFNMCMPQARNTEQMHSRKKIQIKTEIKLNQGNAQRDTQWKTPMISVILSNVKRPKQPTY